MKGVGAVIDAGVKAGATSVGNISFQVSNPDKVQADALAQAVRASRAKADALAQAAGSSVVSVVTIDQQSFREPAYHAAYAGLTVNQALPSPVVPPNNLTSSVTVSVVWQIS